MERITEEETEGKTEREKLDWLHLSLILHLNYDLCLNHIYSEFSLSIKQYIWAGKIFNVNLLMHFFFFFWL